MNHQVSRHSQFAPSPRLLLYGVVASSRTLQGRGRKPHSDVQVAGLATQAWYLLCCSSVAARARCRSMSLRRSTAVQNRQTTERVKHAILNCEPATTPTTMFSSHRRMHAVSRGGALRASATLKPHKPPTKRAGVVRRGHRAVWARRRTSPTHLVGDAKLRHHKSVACHPPAPAEFPQQRRAVCMRAGTPLAQNTQPNNGVHCSVPSGPRDARAAAHTHAAYFVRSCLPYCDHSCRPRCRPNCRHTDASVDRKITFVSFC